MRSDHAALWATVKECQEALHRQTPSKQLQKALRRSEEQLAEAHAELNRRARELAAKDGEATALVRAAAQCSTVQCARATTVPAHSCAPPHTAQRPPMRDEHLASSASCRQHAARVSPLIGSPVHAGAPQRAECASREAALGAAEAHLRSQHELSIKAEAKAQRLAEQLQSALQAQQPLVRARVICCARHCARHSSSLMLA